MPSTIFVLSKSQGLAPQGKTTKTKIKHQLNHRMPTYSKTERIVSKDSRSLTFPTTSEHQQKTKLKNKTMKRFFLLIGLSILTFSLWAEGLPSIIIHKTNGGEWAWLNLYNDIYYTPSTEPGVPARLDCTGRGYSACRVPRDNNLQATNALRPTEFTETSVAEQLAIANAINSIIEASESALTHGTLSGTAAQTIAVPTTVRGVNRTFNIKGQWMPTPRAAGETTLYIYITLAPTIIR